jgi:hypothetical protein
MEKRKNTIASMWTVQCYIPQDVRFPVKQHIFRLELQMFTRNRCLFLFEE